MRRAFPFLLLPFIVICPAVAQTWGANSKTPAEEKIAWAKTEIAKKPKLAQPLNNLAFALIDRARETGDSSFYQQAETAVQSALSLDASNFEALRAKAMLQLAGKHYVQALALSHQLNAKDPDDIATYGMLADGQMEIGDYDEAVDSAQWMMNLRAGNVEGLQRAARLRWLHGETDGALQAYQQAYEEMSPLEVEKRARILSQMAEIQIAAGRLDAAQSSVKAALDEFPNYYMALEASARLADAHKQYVESVALLRKRNSMFPTLETQYRLAQALERAGDVAESKADFAAFETDAMRKADDDENDNRDLIFYELSQGNKPERALKIAESESKKRHDAYTLDAYAWALHENGRDADAEKQIQAALAFGLRDAAVLYHAGTIELKQEDRVAALRDLKASLNVNPFSDVASRAQEMLEKSSALTALSVNGR